MLLPQHQSHPEAELTPTIETFMLVRLAFFTVLFATAACADEISRVIDAPYDPRLLGILSDRTWNTDELTFWFPEETFEGMPAGVRLIPLGNAQRDLVRLAFNDVASFANLRFVENQGPEASLTFVGWNNASRLGRVNARSRDGADKWVSTPGQTWISRSDAKAIVDNTPGSYATRWFRHEMGHIVGLEHPHNNRYRYPAPPQFDNLSYTVMGYRLSGKRMLDLSLEKHIYPTSYMPLDILALQYIYGSNWETNAGDNIYKFSPETGDYWIDEERHAGNPTGKLFLTLWDGGGTDVLDFSAYHTDGTFDLRPGHFSTPSETQRVDFGDGEKAQGSIALPFLPKGDARALIENVVVGDGDNIIMLNYADNHLTLGGGSNRIVVFPGTGKDVISGFGEDDVLNLCPYRIPEKMVHVTDEETGAVVRFDQWPDDEIYIEDVSAEKLRVRIKCDEGDTSP